MNIEKLPDYGIDVLLDKDNTWAKDLFYDIAKDACSYYLSGIHNNEGLYEYLGEMIHNIFIVEYKDYGLLTDVSLTEHDDYKEIIINLTFGNMTVVKSIGYSANIEYH